MKSAKVLIWTESSQCLVFEVGFFWEAAEMEKRPCHDCSKSGVDKETQPVKPSAMTEIKVSVLSDIVIPKTAGEDDPSMR